MSDQNEPLLLQWQVEIKRIMEAVLWYVLTGTRGGPNRVRLLQAIDERPRNANQFAEDLDLDYTTIRHHLEVPHHQPNEFSSDRGAVPSISRRFKDLRESSTSCFVGPVIIPRRFVKHSTIQLDSLVQIVTRKGLDGDSHYRSFEPGLDNHSLGKCPTDLFAARLSHYSLSPIRRISTKPTADTDYERDSGLCSLDSLLEMCFAGVLREHIISLYVVVSIVFANVLGSNCCNSRIR